MPMPDLAVVAEGDLPTGEHWAVKAGGTAEDYYTLLETVHPDGHRDEGGMGGPPLYPGRSLNTYTGGDEPGPSPDPGQDRPAGPVAAHGTGLGRTP
jgi:hypothetical protein